MDKATILHPQKKPYKVTIQDVGSFRKHYIIWAPSSFCAFTHLDEFTMTADAYVAIKPASPDDCINFLGYPDSGS